MAQNNWTVLITCSELDGSEHRTVFIPRDSIHPGICGTFLGFTGFKVICACVQRNSFQDAKVPVFFLNHESTTFFIIRTNIMTFPG